VNIEQNRTPLQRRLADHKSPFINNQWYVAGRTEDFGRELCERTLLGRSLVIWRTEAGEPRAFQNRCAHRAFPLAKSWLEGDAIRCRYHGAKYNDQGEMIEVPCQEHCPRVKLRTYPLVEQGPLVWIWMGEPEKVAEIPVPETPFFGDGWRWITGDHHMMANYLLMTENLMDLSHIPFLHHDTFRFPKEYAAIPVEVETDGNQMRFRRAHTSGHHRALLPTPALTERLDREGYGVNSYTQLVHPGFVYGYVDVESHAPPANAQKMFSSRIVHFMTPESENTSHYWYFHARNFALDDDAHDQVVAEIVGSAFAEDMEAMHALQKLHDTDTHPYREVHFAGDKPTVTMRRLAARLIEAEAQPGS
jgi:phenylpropionate dioxygenase-like ring-hydroxylating dioxygenase large terminal subunit